jgi:hypothetical protein
LTRGLTVVVVVVVVAAVADMGRGRCSEWVEQQQHGGMDVPVPVD